MGHPCIADVTAQPSPSFFDTHCHLDFPPLQARIKDVLARARSAGIGSFVVPGVAPDGWPRIVALAAQEAGVLPAIGLHPFHAHLHTPPLLDELDNYAAQVVAIGEIGLDYLVPFPDRIQQQKAFRSQLRLAVAAGLPVILHCRRAFQDLLAILREEGAGRVRGVMHSFSGSVETARECISLGLLIGVSGTVTYRNAVRPVDVVRQIPLEHLLLETDAPDITPEPFRGRDNEPAFLLTTARKVADLIEIELSVVAEVTTRNARALFAASGRGEGEEA